MNDRRYRPRVELYLRSLCPSGSYQRQSEIVDRVTRLAESDRVADYSVEVWGDRVPADRSAPGCDAVHERLDEFRAWSDRAGTSLEPAFGTGEVGSVLREDTIEVITLPTVCLAEYVDGGLQYVSPCIDDGSVCGVADRLDHLEGGTHDGHSHPTMRH